MDDSRTNRNNSWDERHSQRDVPAPDPWLTGASPYFAGSPQGPVLDLACGLGQNALWLARQGFEVTGVDESAEAVRRAETEAVRRGFTVRFRALQLHPNRPLPSACGGLWGGIVVVHFLDRALFEAIERALKPGGFLVYKTHLKHPLRAPASRPRRRAYLLEPGELLRAFPRLRPVAYQEWAAEGQAFAALLAQKPAGHSL
jgi:tellurite methyltransferase